MQIEINALRKSYKQYGYREVSGFKSILLFLYEQGRYFGADIVPLNETSEAEEECKRVKDRYSDAGYAVQIKKYENNEIAELELYRGFFSYETTAKRIRNKYNDFIKAQSKLNGGHRYEYINSPFRINNDFASSKEIITPVTSVLKKKSPQLLIIEASAGYGKTCTAYEILKTLVECDFCENPLMTELSRNRGANIFRYILLDEIDRVYPTLDSHLVNYEIKTGRIPLIIDGFDELLHKSEIVKSDKEEVFAEVETMLDTIGSLLKGNAKIILTTRKTAIFAGDDFQRWLSKWNNEFEATRISIEVPRIKDWLTQKRYSSIKEAQIPVENIANPVLLTYLRNLTEAEFITHLTEPDSVVKKYFHSLHEREIKRQDLRISPEDQYTIFKNVVRLMINFDQTSDKRSFIREMIIDQNKEILARSLALYPGDQTIELIADKLINHALLDRKGQDEDSIGFINDFVFGTFIGEIMSETEILEIEKSFSAYMVEIGVSAYKVQTTLNKRLLWEKIEMLGSKFENSVLFYFDVVLKGRLERNFNDTIFHSLQIFNIVFEGKLITKSVFINCLFKNCKFSTGVFESVSFIECHFEDCQVAENSHIDDYDNIYTIKCTQKGSDVLDFSENSFLNETQVLAEEMQENSLLSELYKIETKFKSQRIIHLMKQHKKSDHKIIARTIESLEKQNIIRISGLDVFIEVNKLAMVKSRIGIK
jgi:hypothetical protein